MIPIMSTENITKDYGKEKVLGGITLTIYKHTFTAILGPSGSGKSTLLNVLSGITQPTSGTVRYEDTIVTSFSQAQLADWKRAYVGNVFQNYLLLNNLRAEENIKVGICPGTTPLAFDRLTHILEISDILNKFPAQLSGGQQQRVAIARIQQEFMVEDIAINASSKSFYVSGQQLSEILGISTGAYNGVFSTDEIQGDHITTRDGRIEDLKRNAVSNQVSGVINQSVGVLVGAILIFLALYINFQDNTHDILILNMIGHRIKDIRKMLVNVYLPVLWAAFLVTLVPSVLLAKSIQKSLSISTNDYMPFGINVLVVLAAFFLISLIYWGVQITFHLGVKKVIAKREIIEIVYAE